MSMQFFYVKTKLFGVKADSVELFTPDRAAIFLREGVIEPYDEKKHGGKSGSPLELAKTKAAREESQRERAASANSQRLTRR